MNRKENEGLRWRIVVVLLIVSLAPLVISGAGGWFVIIRLLENKTLELHRCVVRSHAESINSYINDRLRALDSASRNQSLEELRRPGAVMKLFNRLNEVYEDGFVDLGVIGEDGRHIVYAGPYDLMDRDYSEASWFRSVIRYNSYVSDVFMGYRQLPHCIIAVKKTQGSESWILRATINSREFDDIVRSVNLGETDEAFIVNSDGFLQTPSSLGSVLDNSLLEIPSKSSGINQERISIRGKNYLRASTWINSGRWMLVVQQEEAEIQSPVRKAFITGVIMLMIAVMLVIATTFMATRHLVRQIDKANAQRDALSRDLLRSAKLASLGEMASGLAHEINNPLAIISAENTNISDMMEELPPDSPNMDEMRVSINRSRRQVERCAGITSKMLQFSRKNEAGCMPTDIIPGLREITGMMKKQAGIRNVELDLYADEHIPPVLVDPIELEQVMVNLINNAFYALNGGGCIGIFARDGKDEVLISVRDNGCGIDPGDLENIFHPFFTTKPPGEGTGLGLAVCYGIVNNWGGEIEALSEPGKGTDILIHLPLFRGDINQKVIKG